MRDVVVCEPVRTPIGKFNGGLSPLSASELGALVIRALLGRTDLAPENIDDVIFGHCYPNSEAPALGRVVALDAGMPVSVPGLQIDRRCGSGLQAVIYAAMQVGTGTNEIVIAGGAESMSNVAFYSTEVRRGVSKPSMVLHDGLARGRVTAGGRNYPVPGGMLQTAENLRRDYDISREAQDEFALSSHHKALGAQSAGMFDEEIVPVEVKTSHGLMIIDKDEHPRAGITLEGLRSLEPIRRNVDPASTVTAGNSSGQNDAAAACIVTYAEKAKEMGLKPLVRLVSYAVAGVRPEIMGIGPVPASQAALARADLSMKDIDLIELNEAFAAQVLACTAEWGFGEADLERLNVNGSGISLGHPVGATGVRILATMAYELARRDARYGLETMCIGGGQGIAAIFERCAD